MNLIEFKDYPSTETPLNAENLNKMQSNIESAINKATIYWQDFVSTSIDVSSNTEATIQINVAKDGYTPVGMLFVDTQNNVDLLKYSLYNNTCYFRVKNISNSTLAITVTTRVLYVKK